MTAPVLEARQLSKSYESGDGSRLTVLANLDLAVAPGEFVAIVGASGSGKSTLLQLLGALDHPTDGQVLLGGEDVARLSDDERTGIRNARYGFVFQFHHLLRDFTAVENVAMPLLIGGVHPDQANARAERVIAQLGLTERGDHVPAQMSGGEQQRVAVARAVVANPVVVLADEPSGNLDPPNAERLHELLASLAREFNTAVVVATHNADLAARADRVLRLEHGRLVPVIGLGPAGV